jgi:eukaryotic-like serine/threonine-protein kinase
MPSFHRIRSFLRQVRHAATEVERDPGVARPPPRSDLVGAQIGPYRLLGSLGKGGTAQVFRAEHRHLGQIRALKILLPEIATSSDVVGRLVTEARAMARLRHPTIAEVFECDVLDDGTAYIAMEYLPGESMRAWLARIGDLSSHPMLAAAIAAVVGDGLSFAHGHGVVHRDLKPENVVLIPDPGDGAAFSLKILDFGIAKLLHEEPVTRTRTGHVVGTPVYMAPEQWRPGSTLDHRTDIYALGCLLFELLSGRPPFDLTSEASLMRAHLEDSAPDIRSLAPAVPAALAGLIARLLAKAPEDRPQTVDQVTADLQLLLGTPAGGIRALLHMPRGCSVMAPHAGGAERSDGAAGSPVGAAAGLFAVTTGGWFTSVRRRHRLVFPSLVGAVGVSSLVGWMWVSGGDGGPKPPAPSTAMRPAAAVPVAAEAPRAPAPATPPREPPRVMSYRTRVTSQPSGAIAWVDGERAARGRTPIALEFGSPGPTRLRLTARGFKTRSVVVWPGRDVVTKVVLVPEPPRDRARRPRRRARMPPPSPTAAPERADPYKKVGDQ